jgi:hypothetical protein
MRNRTSQIADRLRERFEHARIQSLFMELDTAITFGHLALSGSDPRQIQKNTLNAFLAYETVKGLSLQARFDPRSRAAFDQRLARLQNLLKELGEDV